MKTKSGNEVTFDQATELYILRDDKAWSWYELAERYGITTNDAREIFEVAKSGNLEFDDEEGSPFGDGGIYSLYGSSDSIPTGDNFKDAAADPDDLEELEDIITEYRFTELSPAAQDRAIRDAIEEEEHDYYQYGIYGTSQSGISESEIWSAAEDLAKHQPIHIGTDAGGSPYGTARRYRWSVADWQAVTEEQDTGTCWSMDICDVWNAYAARIVALQGAHKVATARAWIHEEAADNAADNGAHEIEKAERRRATFYETMAERIEAAAEELTEEAARAVGNTIDGLIEAERDYYTSPEFWREWLADGDDRFTRDGERI